MIRRSPVGPMLTVLIAFLGALGAPAWGQDDSVPTEPRGGQGDESEEGAAQTAAPIVREIEVIGNLRYRAEEIITGLGQEIGAPYDALTIDRGITNLLSSLKVRVDEISPRDVSATEIDLIVRVHEMRVDLEPLFFGNVDIDLETLKEWAQISGQSELFVYQTNRVRSRLLQEYRRNGYHWVEISVHTRDPEDEGLTTGLTDVAFEIHEGPRVRVREVTFEGNYEFPDRGVLFWKDGLSTLSKRDLEGPGVFNWRGSVFDEEVLEADLQAMRQVYRDRGFLDAIVEVKSLEFSPDRSRVRIHIIVDEGEPYRIGSISIRAKGFEVSGDGRQYRYTEGEELLFPEEELLEVCELEPGRRYELAVRRGDEYRLRDYYGAKGYLSHPSLPPESKWTFLDPEDAANPETHTVDLVYVLYQGRRLKINEIKISGTEHTRDDVVRREISVFPGQTADITEINKSLGRIQGTNFFSDSFSPLEHHEPEYRFLPVEGDNTLVDLEFIVEEGRVVDANFAGGVASDSGIFGLITLSMRNFDITDLPSSPWAMFSEIYHKEAFHGGGEALDIEISPGTQLTRGRLHYFRPDIFDTPLTPIGFDIDLLVRDRIFRTHDEGRADGKIRISRRFSHNTVVSGGFQIAEVEIERLDPPTPAALAAQEAQGKGLYTALLLDFVHRDVDNRLSPRDGFVFSARNSLFTEALGGDFNYLQSNLGFDWYKPIERGEDKLPHVFHFELDAGIMQPFDGTGTVPYSERYQAGGNRLLRGFEFRGVGPNDPVSGEPLGGETLLAGSLEYWFPLYSVLQPGTFRRIETLRGGPFLDFGVLDNSPLELDLDELRVSAGFSIGLSHPLPIQLNFGWPLRKGDGDQLEVLSFSFQFSN